MAGQFARQQPAVSPGGYGLAGDGSGEAWSLRWACDNKDGTHTVLTRAFYAVDLSERTDGGRGSIIEIQDEVIDCRDPDDPGATEIRADYRSKQVGTTTYDDFATAETAAKKAAYGPPAGLPEPADWR